MNAFDEASELAPALRAELAAEIAAQGLPPDFIATIERWYLPLAALLARAHAGRCRPGSDSGNTDSGNTGSGNTDAGKTLIVSINGAQGSGKTTLTHFVRLLLARHFNLAAVEFSLDDFYLTQQQRQQLKADVHPLLATRGVPGTHDLTLASSVLEQLRSCSSTRPCFIPRFDKAQDDRLPASAWTRIVSPVAVVLFEGWCNHAPVSSVADLVEPCNELERLEDADGRWRQYVNQQLQAYHTALFSQAHILVHLAVPGFEQVYQWRQLQEAKLASKAGAAAPGVMDSGQLQRFIQHYERLTRDCLAVLPTVADIVLQISRQHQIEALQYHPQLLPDQAE